jgi:hypothetical protein
MLIKVMKANNYYLLLIVALVLSSCSKAPSDKFRFSGNHIDQSLIAMNDTIPLDRAMREFKDVKYSLLCLTPEMRASQFEERGTSEYQGELEEQSSSTVYRLRLSSQHPVNVIDVPSMSLPDRKARLQYFMEDFPKTIQLVRGADTLAPAFYQLQQPNTMLNYIDLLISFETPHASRSGVIQFEDELFNTGRIKLRT